MPDPATPTVACRAGNTATTSSSAVPSVVSSVPGSEWTAIGYVVKPHGVRGELRLSVDVPWESLAGDVSHVRLVPRGGGAPLVAGVRARSVHRGALALVDTVDSPETAAAWRGATVEILATHVPPCEAGEFYLAELTGVEVFDTDGVLLGVMQTVVDNAGQPLGTIAAQDGAERLLPLVPETIAKFERGARRLNVRVPLGLWDA